MHNLQKHWTTASGWHGNQDMHRILGNEVFWKGLTLANIACHGLWVLARVFLHFTLILGSIFLPQTTSNISWNNSSDGKFSFQSEILSWTWAIVSKPTRQECLLLHQTTSIQYAWIWLLFIIIWFIISKCIQKVLTSILQTRHGSNLQNGIKENTHDKYPAHAYFKLEQTFRAVGWNVV